MGDEIPDYNSWLQNIQTLVASESPDSNDPIELPSGLSSFDDLEELEALGITKLKKKTPKIEVESEGKEEIPSITLPFSTMPSFMKSNSSRTTTSSTSSSNTSSTSKSPFSFSSFSKRISEGLSDIADDIDARLDGSYVPTPPPPPEETEKKGRFSISSLSSKLGTITNKVKEHAVIVKDVSLKIGKETAGTLNKTVKSTTDSIKLQLAVENSSINFVVDRVLAFSLVGGRKLEIVLDDPSPRTINQINEELQSSIAWLNMSYKDNYNIVDCGFDFASMLKTGSNLLSAALTSSGSPFNGKMTQLVANINLNVPTVKTISLACQAIQSSISSPEKVVLLVTTHRLHAAAILGCYLAFQGYCKTSFEGLKMVYDFWNVKQLTALKPESSRLVGLAIVPSLIRVLVTFDELLELKKMGKDLVISPVPEKDVTDFSIGASVGKVVSNRVAPLVLRAMQLKSLPKSIYLFDTPNTAVATMQIDVYSLSSSKGITDLLWSNTVKRTVNSSAPTLFLPHIKIHGEIMITLRQIVNAEKNVDLISFRLHTGTLQPHEFPNIGEPRTSISFNRKDFDETTNDSTFTEDFSISLLFGKILQALHETTKNFPLPSRNNVTITPLIKCCFVRCNSMFFPPPAASQTACPDCRTLNYISDLALPYFLTSNETAPSLPLPTTEKVDLKEDKIEAREEEE